MLRRFLVLVVVSLVFGSCGGGGGGGDGNDAAALDPTFEGGGILLVDPPAGALSAFLRSFAVQPDRRAVLLIQAFGGMSTGNYVVRLLESGLPDPSFGVDGVAELVPPIGYVFGTQRIRLQPDGRILVAGNVFDGMGTKLALARLTDTGAMDGTFGTNGVVTFDVNLSGELELHDVMVQSDDRVVGVGFGDNTNGDSDLVFVRVLANGMPDMTFNGMDGDPTGVQIIDLAGGVGGEEDILSGVLQADGKIIGVGRTDQGTAGASSVGLVVRLTTAGLLDATFDGDGLAFVDVPGSDFDLLYDTLLQPDGRIVCAGTASTMTEAQVVCARLLTGGGLDPSFNSGDGDPPGMNVYSVGGQQEDVSIARDSQGRLYVGGARNGVVTDPLVARLRASGSLDEGFAPGGVFVIPLGVYAEVRSVAVDSLDRVLIGAAGIDDSWVIRLR